jgi:hypothetical protein
MSEESLRNDMDVPEDATDGRVIRLEVTVDGHPEKRVILAMWLKYGEEDVFESFKADLASQYANDGYAVLYREVAQAEFDYVQAVTALTTFPTWNELVKAKMLKPMVHRN